MLGGTKESSQCAPLIGGDNYGEPVLHALKRLGSLLKVDRQAEEIANAAALRGFSSHFPINATQTSPRNVCAERCFFFFAYERTAPCRLGAIRSADVKVFGASARLHFRGTTVPIDQSAQTCPGPSPPMHHGTACWSQKSLTTTNISAATACLPLISCREIFLEYPSPFEEGEERKPHPSPPQSPGNYSQTHCSFFASSFFSPPLAVLPVLAASLLFVSLCTVGLTVSAQALLTIQPLHLLDIQYFQF